MLHCRISPTALAFLVFPLLMGLTAPARAQLLSETVIDTTRQCTYVGEELNPDGQLVPRVFNVGLGQNCPSTPPVRDPNAPVPPNAPLTGERTSNGNRICIYEEAGIEYRLPVNLSLRCAMTPALLEEARRSAR